MSLSAFLPSNAPIEDRVAAVADTINGMIDKFESKFGSGGIQTFQLELLKIIKDALLSDERWVDVVKCGVHPDNREGCGLVPMDVHDLLELIVAAGWSWGECAGALASEIPPNEKGQEWRAFNKMLAENSDGLLPECLPDLLEIVSARGSHTTSGVRCIQMGSKGVHESLCTGGVISKSKILETQPSMAEPLDKGMKYTVVRWQLVEACPRLMEVLSRTGNASHGVARTQTALQGCKRVFDLHSNMPQGADLWDRVARAAAVGMPPDYANTAKCYAAFVQQWSGGKDGHVLDELVDYERTLTLKRKISPLDMKAMGEIKFWEGPRYVPAMVKALLLAPPNYVNDGIAKLFSAADFASLSSNGSKIRKAATQAIAVMSAAHTFFDAYAVLTKADKFKILPELEVKCVMFAHGKKSTTRVELKSFAHIALAAYELAAEKMSHSGRQLPKWELIKHVHVVLADSMQSTAIREIDSEGTIADEELRSHGFVVGATITVKVFTSFAL
jgi:hypothetical protein